MENVPCTACGKLFDDEPPERLPLRLTCLHKFCKVCLLKTWTGTEAEGAVPAYSHDKTVRYTMMMTFENIVYFQIKDQFAYKISTRQNCTVEREALESLRCVAKNLRCKRSI